MKKVSKTYNPETTHPDKIRFETHRVYVSWVAMKNSQKVFARNNKSRPDAYRVEWKNFNEFFLDVGFRPPGAVLCRYDNHVSFNVDNCYWGTPDGTGIDNSVTLEDLDSEKVLADSVPDPVRGGYNTI